jgi:hypothetical protein
MASGRSEASTQMRKLLSSTSYTPEGFLKPEFQTRKVPVHVFFLAFFIVRVS